MGKRKKLKKKVRKVERALSDAERQRDRAQADVERYQQSKAVIDSLGRADQRWLSEALAHGAHTMVRESKLTPRGMRDAAQRHLADVTQRAGARFAHLSDAQRRGITTYIEVAVRMWQREAMPQIAELTRMSQFFDIDEVILWMHLYHQTASGAPDGHASRFNSALAQWYGHMAGSVQYDACVKGATNFFVAVGSLGEDITRAVIAERWPKPPQKPGRAAVKHYLRCVQQTYEGATDREAVRDLTGEDDRAEAQRLARLLWAALRNARVFEVDVDTYRAINQEVYNYAWVKVAGLPDDTTPEAISAEQGQEALDRLHEAAEQLPVFADIMPFEHIFIGFGDDGLAVPNEVVEQMVARVPERLIRARNIGVLVAPIFGGDDVHVVFFLRLTSPGGEDYVVPCAERLSTEGPARWMNPALLFPWQVNALLSFIHEHRTTVLEQSPGLGVKRDYKKLAKTQGVTVIPKPYYVVPLRDKVVREKAARKAVGAMARRSPLSYRHDRRGHERCRIQRGALPLDPKKAAKLEQRGYKVFTINAPDAETQRRLIERRQRPKRSDEWIAIKTTWVDPHVVGDESLPYVPAVRVSEKQIG